MELTRSARPAHERCPYCHDQLEGSLARIPCTGCGTEHHAECVAELGRCSVFGCETPLEAPAPAPNEEEAPVPESPVRRLIRERVRRRAQEFVRKHASRPNEAPSRHEAVLSSWRVDSEERTAESWSLLVGIGQAIGFLAAAVGVVMLATWLLLWLSSR